jgi:hypothetical protein
LNEATWKRRRRSIRIFTAKKADILCNEKKKITKLMVQQHMAKEQGKCRGCASNEQQQ